MSLLFCGVPEPDFDLFRGAHHDLTLQYGFIVVDPIAVDAREALEDAHGRVCCQR